MSLQPAWRRWQLTGQIPSISHDTTLTWRPNKSGQGLYDHNWRLVVVMVVLYMNNWNEITDVSFEIHLFVQRYAHHTRCLLLHYCPSASLLLLLLSVACRWQVIAKRLLFPTRLNDFLFIPGRGCWCRAATTAAAAITPFNIHFQSR